LKKIKSKWVYHHAIPQKKICHTSYYQVIPAYIAILNFALKHDKKNKWFCYLTESCCPIISPTKFRELFQKYKNQTIMPYSKAHWNINIHQRANLAMLPKIYHLANDPWFVLTRENLKQVINFVNTQKSITKTICSGGLANETLFAVIFYFYKELKNKTKNRRIICQASHIADWNRMSSTTSPHVFKDANEEDIKFIDRELERNKYTLFIRKVATEFPDNVLRDYIFEQYDEDNKLILNEPFEMLFSKNIVILKAVLFILFLVGLYINICKNFIEF
jgi:hypothetical protein